MEKVQELFATIVPSGMLMLWAVVEIVPVPQPPVRLSGLEIINPLGRLSVNDTPVKSVAAFGFVIVKVSVVLLFNAIVDAEKLLTMVGGDCAPADAQKVPNTAIITAMNR